MKNKNSNTWLYKRIYSLRPAYCGTLLKRLFRIKRCVIATEKGKFFIDPCSHFGLTLLEHGRYEEELVATFESTLKDGSVFIDVGANEGYFSIVASRLVGKEGRVITVEPQSRLHPVLQRNKSLNASDNIELNQVAISNEEGSADIFLAPDTITGSTSLFKTRKYPVPKETVKMTTLGQLLDSNAIEFVELMKMDIEGFEYEAILGSREVFRSKRIRNLALELHTWLLKERALDPDQITSFLRSTGYTVTNYDKFVLASASQD
jgi:FkbM family methyltransferase